MIGLKGRGVRNTACTSLGREAVESGGFMAGENRTAMSHSAEQGDASNSTRREFVKKASYVAPAILTLPVFPQYAKAGSVKHTGKQEKRGDDFGAKPGNGNPKHASQARPKPEKPDHNIEAKPKDKLAHNMENGGTDKFEPDMQSNQRGKHEYDIEDKPKKDMPAQNIQAKGDKEQHDKHENDRASTSYFKPRSSVINAFLERGVVGTSTRMPPPGAPLCRHRRA
jgi:hypothetical protein